MTSDSLMPVRPRLLLVDDVPTNLRALTDLLPPHFELHYANSGSEALSLLKQGPLPDLIVLDVMLPDMDGFAVCQEIKRWVTTQHIPVIFITALNEGSHEVLGLGLGAADYISKPFDPTVALARILKQLQPRRNLDASEGDQPVVASHALFLSGGAWTISFQGSPPFQLVERQGLAYLKILLSLPGRWLLVEELIFLVVPKERERLLSLAAEVIKPEQMQVIITMSKSIPSIFSKAHNPATGLTAPSSIIHLLGLLQREGLFERIAPVNEQDRDRHRKSVGNAIRRAIADIAEYDPQLAAHLQPPTLRMGYRLIYQPAETAVWF